MNYQFDWSVLSTYAPLLREGFRLTVELSAVSMVASLALGTLVGAGRHVGPAWLRAPLGAYTEFFRNVPLIVQLFFWYFAVGLDTWPAAIVGLTVYTSAYVAEIVRAGLGSIPRTQTEAARAFGLTPYQVLRHVLLPQALVRVVPPLAIECINVIKNSSIAMTIGLTELTFATQQIESETFRGFEAATAITVLYVVLAFVVVAVMNVLERRLHLDIKVG